MPVVLRRWLFLVIAIHIGACAAANALVDQTTNQSVLAEYGIALILAQHSLLYIWAGLGIGGWRRRLAIVYGVSVLAWTLIAILDGSPFAAILPVMAFNSAIMMVIFVTPFAVARARGFRLHWFSKQNLPPAKAFQMSIRGMLIVMVVVACLLAIGRSVKSSSTMRGTSVTYGMDTTDTSRLKSQAVMIVGLPTLFLSSAMLSVWATLSVGTVASRMVVSGLALAAGGTFLPFCHISDAYSYLYWASLPLLTFLITSFTLLPFRLAGHRFVRGDQQQEIEETPSEDLPS